MIKVSVKVDYHHRSKSNGDGWNTNQHDIVRKRLRFSVTDQRQNSRRWNPQLLKNLWTQQIEVNGKLIWCQTRLKPEKAFWAKARRRQIESHQYTGEFNSTKTLELTTYLCTIFKNINIVYWNTLINCS